MNVLQAKYPHFLITVITLFLTVGVASAAEPVDSTELRAAVTLENIRLHQAALQSVADANGGTRTSGTLGYDASVDYVANQLLAASYDVTVQPFSYLNFEELSLPEFEQIAV